MSFAYTGPRIEFADGTRIGERIPGSKYVRSICRKCRQPIRVRKVSLVDYCTGCVEPRATDRPKSPFRRPDVEYHGSHLRDDI